MQLDELDAALLHALQRDGRTSFETLSSVVGLSRVGARNRVQRLLEHGALEISAAVHPSVRRLTALGHLSVYVDTRARPVAEGIAAMPQMPLVSMVAGRQSIIAEVRTEDLSQLRVAVEHVRAIHGVGHVDTAVYTERIKDMHSAVAQTGPNHHRLDATDDALIEVLQRNGRASYTELAAQASVSTSTARARTQRLLADGVVHVGATIKPGALGLGHMCGFGLSLAATPDTTRAIAEFADVHYLSECIGSWDAIGTLVCASQREIADALDKIRELPGVRGIDAWAHLHVLKEDYTLPAARPTS